MLLLCVKSMKPLHTWNKIQTHWWPSRPYGIWSLPCSPVSPQYAFCTLVTLGFVSSFLLKRLTPLSHPIIPPDHCISSVHPSDLTLPSTFLAFRLKNLRTPCIHLLLRPTLWSVLWDSLLLWSLWSRGTTDCQQSHKLRSDFNCNVNYMGFLDS